MGKRILLCVSALLLAAAARAADRVTVTKTPPTVETRTFDPHKPPAEMPKITPPEVAVAHSDFSIQVDFTYRVVQQRQKPGACTATIEVSAARLKLTLHTTIWLPTNVDAKTRAHEVGHQRLSENYYKTADADARKLGAAAVGQRHTDTADTCQAAADKALQEAMKRTVDGYMQAVHAPADRAQKAYDRITDHGRNAISEDAAIEGAMKEATTRRSGE